MARAPETYTGMGEEGLRQVLLSGLDTAYAGAVSAEAFNATGKTDILVRDGARAVLVAECRTLDGDQGTTRSARPVPRLLDVVRQQTRAGGLRRQGRPGGRGQEKAGALAEHRAVTHLRKHSETELRGRLVFGTDNERHAELAVLFIHLPAPS